MPPASPRDRFFWSSLLLQASVQRRCFFLFQCFGLSFEKIGGRSMKALLPEGSRFFLRCPHKMEGQSLLPMRAVLEVSARSTESRALSLFFLGFSFPFRPPHKPSFPVVFQCSWFTFNEGMQGLSSISTAYGNIKLVSLAAKDDCVFAVEILTSAVGSKILWWLQPFHYLFLITRSLYFTYRETLLRPWNSLRNYSMIKDRLCLPRNLTVLPCFSGFMFAIFAALSLCFFVMFESCFTHGLSNLF
ncbi:hypothetical protein V6N13_039665 [Hibiscus sabdariffa]